MENDRLNEIRELNPDYDISMHELDVCVGDNEDACHAIDKMIEWYYQVEEPEFLKFYNCHLEMIK